MICHLFLLDSLAVGLGRALEARHLSPVTYCRTNDFIAFVVVSGQSCSGDMGVKTRARSQMLCGSVEKGTLMQNDPWTALCIVWCQGLSSP